MDNLFKPTGDTPFELAEARMLRGQAQVKAACALQELIETSRECDVMIQAWKEQLLRGEVEPEVSDVAAQALAEKRTCETAITALTKLMLEQFNFEA